MVLLSSRDIIVPIFCAYDYDENKRRDQQKAINMLISKVPK